MIRGIIITTLAGFAVGSLVAAYSKELSKIFNRREDEEDDHYWDNKQTYNISELVAEGEDDPFERIREKINSNT